MERNEIMEAIQGKKIELEAAIQLGKSNEDLLKMYKELKELQYRLVQVELTLEAV